MTDMELAEEIEQHKLYLGGYPTEAQCEQIIAALRRVPIAKHCLAGDGGCTFHKCDCPTQEGYSPTDRQATQNLTRPPSGEMVMVPREPTEAMRFAGNVEQSRQEHTNMRSASAIYRAILSAAEAEGRKS